MSIIIWIILGAIAGWLASKIMSTDAQQGWMANIVIGIVGALVGGFLVSLLMPGTGVTGLNITSIIVAILGSVVVLFIYKMFTGRGKSVV